MITFPAQTMAGSAFRGFEPTTLSAMAPFTTSMQQMAAKAMVPYNARFESLMQASTAPMRAQIAAIVAEVNRPLTLKMASVVEEAMRPTRERQSKLLAELIRIPRMPMLEMLRDANSLVDTARAAGAIGDLAQLARTPLLLEMWRIRAEDLEVASRWLDSDVIEIDEGEAGRSTTPFEVMVFVCLGALLGSAWLVSIQMTNEERVEFWVQMLLPFALSAAVALMVKGRE